MQLVEQGLGVLQVWGVKAFGEPVVDFGKHRPRLVSTSSIARLLAKQGKRDEARKMLSEIYNWFTEGFDTADLKDAKTLLDELAT